MKKMTFAIALATSLVLLAGCAGDAPAVAAANVAAPAIAPEKVSAERVARGRYLVTIASCNDCHTPFKIGPNGPEPDMSRELSGHPEQFAVSPPPKFNEHWVWGGTGTNTAFAGPWGVSYSANLTPDTNTGLGIWTEEQFIKTLRTGRHWGVSRPIQPPMPWRFINQMTDEDLKAVFAYLRSIKPITNHVPDYQPPAEG